MDPLTYRAAGVDIGAGDEAVRRIRRLAEATTRPEVMGGIGAFAAFVSIPPGYREPVLVSSTDGVGTKLKIAFATDRHDTIGIDLVAMGVNDLLVHGAEPLYFLDYLAVGQVVPEHVAELVEGVAEGCRRAGCALLGGETAEHPGTMPADQFDLAGFCVGIVEEAEEDTAPLYGFVKPEKSIGRMKAFHGHFGGGFVRTFTYIAMHGPDGLKDIAQYAVLNANYLLAKLRNTYHVPFDRICMHEFVAEGRFEGSDVRALDIAKRLMDYNFHPPTNYFPLIVHEALMIEPTETENKDTLDAFTDALIRIAEEAKTQPDLLHKAPVTTKFGRMDEVKAARELVLCCWLPEGYDKDLIAE